MNNTENKEFVITDGKNNILIQSEKPENKNSEAQLKAYAARLGSLNQNKRLCAYQELIEKAAQKRSENITVPELADKLNVKPTGIYRLEKGDHDPKLSTILNYLGAFGYHLEIVPDKVEVVPNPVRIKKSPKIEVYDVKTCRRHRLNLLKILIRLEEEYLNMHDNDEE